MQRPRDRVEQNIEVVLGQRFNIIMPIYRGILSFARQRPRWHLRLQSFCSERILVENEYREPDGLLLLGSAIDVRLRKTLHAQKKAVATFFAELPHDVFPTVALDERAIGRASANHLLAQGFSHFAFCGSDAPWALQREDGFRAALAEAGAAPPQVLRGTGMQDRPAPELRGARLRRWLRSLETPVGIMAHNDELAAALLQVAMKLHLRIPEQCAIVGVDDDEVVCETAPVPLSSVNTNLPAVGYAAAQMLDDLLAGEAPPPTPPVIPPRGIVPRASSNTLAFDDFDLREAVSMIRAQACQGLTVAQVARSLAISPRALQLKFQEGMHCRPSDEIRRVKLAHARALLQETDLMLREVARRAGYSSLPQLCVAFKKRYGMTLQEYRRNGRQ